MRYLKQTRGFTLIEVMIVVVIIGILVGLAIPRYTRATVKAKQTEAKLILKQIYTMQRAYRQGSSPATYAHGGDVRVAGEVFEDIGVEIGDNAAYTYTMAAAANTFSCTATTNLDDDAAVDSWTIDQDGNLAADCDDVVEVAACA